MKTNAAPAVAEEAAESPLAAELAESYSLSSIFFLAATRAPCSIHSNRPRSHSNQNRKVRGAAPTDQLGRFVSVVLADTEDAWHSIFRQMGREYEEPKLVLFTSQTRTGCGFASTASGPFYCPEDRRVFIDLSFYRTLEERFGAPGEFAQAYVIAHEVGHHVQNLLGISDQVQAARGRVSQAEYNQLSVRLELQADFLAGVWAHYADRTKHIVESGDIDSALRAATAIGDDTLQRRSRGYAVPDSFTHGTSQQRVRWFRRGYETGDLRQGDTFNTRDL